MVPPSLGITPWREVFGNLKAVGFDGWISVQFEYWGVEPWKTWTADQRDEQVRADLAYLRALA
jgi:sugar phosphate isomerase/epimerase